MKKNIPALLLILCLCVVISCNNKTDAYINPAGLTDGEWIDLGLPSGLLWCSHNIGAEKPEEYGDYFSWGEVSPKRTYTWGNYEYVRDENSFEHPSMGGYRLTKYCGNAYDGYYGYTDSLTNLTLNDDAAYANSHLGVYDSARMPTGNEWWELVKYTHPTWMSQNGVYGVRLKGRNGNSIFLPAAGYRWCSDDFGSKLYEYLFPSVSGANIEGFYWTTNLYEDGPARAWSYHFNKDGGDWSYGTQRCDGQPVRAVRDPNKRKYLYPSVKELLGDALKSIPK